MLSTTCPSCGAALSFGSSVTVYTVCRSCGSMVVRTDGGVQSIGVMAALPAEISPLQVGTGLRVGNRNYRLMGRVRMVWDDGAWSEWFIDDGTEPGWLIEAQGFLSVAFEQPVPQPFTGETWPGIGQEFDIGGARYRVTDLKKATCAGSEGELPFRAPRGRVSLYADMTSASAGFAGLEQSDDGRRFFVGTNAHFDDLRLIDLRDVEGWTRPPPGARVEGDPEYPPAS